MQWNWDKSKKLKNNALIISITSGNITSLTNSPFIRPEKRRRALDLRFGTRVNETFRDIENFLC